MRWRRRVYFLLERLHISAAERYFMLALMLLLMATGLLRIMAGPQGSYKPDYYEQLHGLLKAKEQQVMAEEREILMRYGSFAKANIATGFNDQAASSGINGNQSRSTQQQLAPARADSTATAADTTENKGAGSSPQPHDSDKHTGSDKQVLINKASVDALTQLPGIGPVIAGRIVHYRMEHGPFKSADELRKVKGIGEKRLEDIRPYIKL